MSAQKRACIAALAALAIAPAVSGWSREPLSNDQVRQQIVQESVAQYHATGHPCACPYDHARNGSSCGRRSAYSRPGGAAPLCYPNDVTDGMVQDWRRRHAQ